MKRLLFLWIASVAAVAAITYALGGTGMDAIQIGAIGGTAMAVVVGIGMGRRD